MTELDEGSIHPLGTVCAVPGVHGVCQYNFLLAISEIHLSFVLFSGDKRAEDQSSHIIT